ncbi:hypothetical protein ACFLZV_02855 [Candidatus Margulisiibacteriota bacterium]
MDDNKMKHAQISLEKIKNILEYATLASSTHNSQPWLFEIKKNSCLILSDDKYHLKEADPDGKYLYMSIGCCLENLIIAAKYFSLYKDFKLYNLKDNNIVAEVFFDNCKTDLKKSDDTEKLFKAIKPRKTRRGKFISQAIPNNVLKMITRLNTIQDIQINLISNKETIKKLAKLTSDGVRYVYKKKAFRTELANWINHSLSKKREGMPTFSLKIPWFLSFFVRPGLKLFNLSRVLAKLNYKGLCSAPLICVLCVKNNNKINWLNAGRIAQRLMLGFQAEGLENSIAIASTLTKDLRNEVKSSLNTDWEPLFLFGTGHMNGSQPVTPKQLLNKKLITELD